MMHFLRKIAIPVAAILALLIAADRWGAAGFLLVLSGLVMWALLHFTRMMTVLKRASNRPIGYCDSAVMLNAKLKAGVNLLHVVAMTRSLGEQLSRPDTEPEVYKWTDGSDSSVVCEFRNGRLATWELRRPAEAAAPAATEPGPTE